MKKFIYIFLYFLTYLNAPYAMEEHAYILSKPNEHTRFLRTSLATAQQRVIIVSPFITRWRLEDTHFNGNAGLGKPIQDAIGRGIEVTVFTDEKFDEAKEYARIGREMLARIGVDLKIVSRLHSKNLIIDNSCITFGSFNWLSAETDPTKTNCNYETTTILRQEQAENAIAKIVPELIRLEVKLSGGGYSSSLLDLSISDEEQVDHAIELFREGLTRPHYRQLAQHVLSQQLVNCFNANTGFKILRRVSGIEGTNQFIGSAVGPLTIYCVRATDFVELADILVAANLNELAVNVANNILITNRSEEYEQLDYLCSQLNRMGLGEIGRKFEEYVLGSNSK